MQKVALIIKRKQTNAVESTGNQNNQIKPCRLCLQFNSMRFSTSTPTTQHIQLFDSKFPAVFHYQKVTDHSPCLPNLLLLNAEDKSSSRTNEIRHYDCHVKFKNTTSGRAVVGYGIKVFVPRPLYYVTRSPGNFYWWPS